MIAPASVAATIPTMIAGTIAQPWLTFSQPTSTYVIPNSSASDRSRSPLVSGISRPMTSTSVGALSPKMLVKFDHWKNVSGRRIPKNAITMTNATGSSEASAVRELKIREAPDRPAGPPGGSRLGVGLGRRVHVCRHDGIVTSLAAPRAVAE